MKRRKQIKNWSFIFRMDLLIEKTIPFSWKLCKEQQLHFIKTFYQIYADLLFSNAGRKLKLQTRQIKNDGKHVECIIMDMY